MLYFVLLLKICLLFAICLTSAIYSKPRRRCKFGDDCWPSQQAWQAFNESISGKLVNTLPSAAVCHSEHFDAHACAIAKQNWTSSFWRTSQVGGYTAMLWENGPLDQCLINSSLIDACQQGLVPHFSVNASCIADVQAAVRFASEKDLYLVVKNTGHDHLGRSSGSEGFAIWTHNLKGITWHDEFVPAQAPRNIQPAAAVTVQAGEQWIDVYNAASKQHRIVVGGGARTVGAAGGWLTGGGHSPFAATYGLGVDNVLEINIINAAGEHKTLNEHTDPDYFWAVRGGGGSAWGVITSITYRTHPEPNHLQLGFVQVNATTKSAFRTALSKSLEALDPMTEAGYMGYGMVQLLDPAKPTVPGMFGAVFLLPNGTNATFESAIAPFLAMNSIPNVSSYGLPIVLPRWKDYVDNFLTDPNIAQNVVDASRLLTPEIVHNKTANSALVDLILEHGVGFNYLGRVKPMERNKTSVHPIWARSIGIFSTGVNWNDTATYAERESKRHSLVMLSKRLGEIVGEGGGTYINEANPFEPEWEEVFWGSNYPRLLKIKEKIDPTNLFVCNRCVGSDVLFQP